MKNKLLIGVIGAVVLIGAWHLSSNNAGPQNAAEQTVGVNVGNTAPDFTFTTLQGDSFDSKTLRGKTVVVTSSAAWCSTCIAEAREFSRVYPQFLKDEVFFLTIDIDPRNSDEAILEFQENTNTPWSYANAQGGSEAIKKLRLNRFEVTYVIDGRGVIQYKDAKITSSQELSGEISNAL